MVENSRYIGIINIICGVLIIIGGIVSLIIYLNMAQSNPLTATGLTSFIISLIIFPFAIIGGVLAYKEKRVGDFMLLSGAIFGLILILFSFPYPTSNFGSEIVKIGNILFLIGSLVPFILTYREKN